MCVCVCVHALPGGGRKGLCEHASRTSQQEGIYIEGKELIHENLQRRVVLERLSDGTHTLVADLVAVEAVCALPRRRENKS